MITERSIVNSFLVRVIVLQKNLNDLGEGEKGGNTYTNVKLPKCCKVSKMKI